MNFSIDQVSFAQKRVLIRVDFNVPLNEAREVTDDTRIRAALPTIKKVLNDGGAAILMSHLGRPKGADPELSMKHIAPKIAELLGVKVHVAPDCIGDDALAVTNSMNFGEVALLENLRFHKEETAGDILSISPYHKLPILVDRDLAIHDPSVMMEYLDERFPHPPLLPVYPVARANSRTLMLRIDREWCPIVDTLIAGELPEKELIKLREELLHEISSIAPTFKEFKYFMSDEFTLVDCCFAPILWRLPSIGIRLPVNRHLKPLIDYQKEIFKRPGFLDSLSSLERDLKED